MMSVIKCITLEEELKKNPELKITDIHILREWCEKQPHLPKIQDVELAIFLHRNYYHIEPTKSMIENYYTYRTHAPELFSNRDILKEKRLRDTFKAVAQIHLENKTKEGYSIIVSQILDKNPSSFYYNELLNSCLMVMEEFLWTHGSTPGYIIVIDNMGMTVEHMKRINLTTLKKIILYVQDAIPVRLMGVHIINMSPIVQKIFNIAKPIIKAELMNKIYFHSTVQNASEYFPIEALPNELGGKAGAIQNLMDAQLKKIEYFRDWFLEDERNNRVNESLRIGKSKTSGDLFGVDGSFKKLEID